MGTSVSPWRQARAMADPEIQGILSDPVMRQVLQDFSNNPKAGGGS